MASWRDPITSLAPNTVPVGRTEGAVLDLRGLFDRHAMKIYVSSSGGSPAYKVQIEGAWSDSGGFVVLAEVDQSSAPPSEHHLVVVEGKPCRLLRAVITVTSGTVSPSVQITSEE